jgi:hypothetical protein
MTSARSYAFQVSTAVVLVIASLWAATQWAAAMLGYPVLYGCGRRANGSISPLSYLEPAGHGQAVACGESPTPVEPCE